MVSTPSMKLTAKIQLKVGSKTTTADRPVNARMNDMERIKFPTSSPLFQRSQPLSCPMSHQWQGLWPGTFLFSVRKHRKASSNGSISHTPPPQPQNGRSREHVCARKRSGRAVASNTCARSRNVIIPHTPPPQPEVCIPTRKCLRDTGAMHLQCPH